MSCWISSRLELISQFHFSIKIISRHDRYSILKMLEKSNLFVDTIQKILKNRMYSTNTLMSVHTREQPPININSSIMSDSEFMQPKKYLAKKNNNTFRETLAMFFIQLTLELKIERSVHSELIISSSRF